MHKFNDSGIFTGYLKQILKEFNLPKIKVYTKKYQEYFNKYGVEHPEILETITATKSGYPTQMRYIPYIKDGMIQEYVDGKWELVGARSHNKMKHIYYYNYGDKLLNYTKTLQLKNNLYDSYTHEYLGDYLRFKRDYSGINLMPLYNCFSNRPCDSLDIEWQTYNQSQLETTNDRIKAVTYKFNSKDENYKIYMMPIKLFQTYTIAIDSSSPIELCCGIYGEHQDTREKFKSLPKYTYQKVAKSQFSKPFLYNKTSFENLNEVITAKTTMELLQNECDLKLFIKVPKNNTSTIVILEGDYLGWNDRNYFKTDVEITRVSEWGKGTPTDTGVDTKLNIDLKAENLYYLDVDSGNLYKSVLSSNKYIWILLKNIWKKSTIENRGQDILTNSTKIVKKNNIHIDKELPISKEKRSAIKLEVLKKALLELNIFVEPTATVEEIEALLPTDVIESVEEAVKDKLTMLAFTSYKNKYVGNNLNKNSAYMNTQLNRLLVNPMETWTKYTNHRVINIDKITNSSNIILSSPLQLLQFNTKEQHPFADRLIEYLTENAITKDNDELPNNIRRVQKALKLNRGYNDYEPNFAGIWDDKINKVVYEYMTTKNIPSEATHDLLGYIDKDVEKYYAHNHEETTNTGKIISNSTSISMIELTEEDTY